MKKKLNAVIEVRAKLNISQLNVSKARKLVRQLTMVSIDDSICFDTLVVKLCRSQRYHEVKLPVRKIRLRQSTHRCRMFGR